MIVAPVETFTLPVVTEKLTEDAFAGTITLAGTPAAELLLESATTIPPVPAAAVSMTVPVPECPLVIGLGLTETLASAGGGPTVRPKEALTVK